MKGMGGVGEERRGGERGLRFGEEEKLTDPADHP